MDIDYGTATLDFHIFQEKQLKTITGMKQATSGKNTIQKIQFILDILVIFFN